MEGLRPANSVWTKYRTRNSREKWDAVSEVVEADGSVNTSFAVIVEEMRIFLCTISAHPL